MSPFPEETLNDSELMCTPANRRCFATVLYNAICPLACFKSNVPEEQREEEGDDDINQNRILDFTQRVLLGIPALGGSSSKNDNSLTISTIDGDEVVNDLPFWCLKSEAVIWNFVLRSLLVSGRVSKIRRVIDLFNYNRYLASVASGWRRSSPMFAGVFGLDSMDGLAALLGCLPAATAAGPSSSQPGTTTTSRSRSIVAVGYTQPLPAAELSTRIKFFGLCWGNEVSRSASEPLSCEEFFSLDPRRGGKEGCLNDFSITGFLHPAVESILSFFKGSQVQTLQKLILHPRTGSRRQPEHQQQLALTLTALELEETIILNYLLVGQVVPSCVAHRVSSAPKRIDHHHHQQQQLANEKNRSSSDHSRNKMHLPRSPCLSSLHFADVPQSKDASSSYGDEAEEKRLKMIPTSADAAATSSLFPYLVDFDSAGSESPRAISSPFVKKYQSVTVSNKNVNSRVYHHTFMGFPTAIGSTKNHNDDDDARRTDLKNQLVRLGSVGNNVLLRTNNYSSSTRSYSRDPYYYRRASKMSKDSKTAATVFLTLGGPESITGIRSNNMRLDELLLVSHHDHHGHEQLGREKEQQAKLVADLVSRYKLSIKRMSVAAHLVDQITRDSTLSLVAAIRAANIGTKSLTQLLLLHHHQGGVEEDLTSLMLLDSKQLHHHHHHHPALRELEVEVGYEERRVMERLPSTKADTQTVVALSFSAGVPTLEELEPEAAVVPVPAASEGGMLVAEHTSVHVRDSFVEPPMRIESQSCHCWMLLKYPFREGLSSCGHFVGLKEAGHFFFAGSSAAMSSSGCGVRSSNEGNISAALAEGLDVGRMELRLVNTPVGGHHLLISLPEERNLPLVALLLREQQAMLEHTLRRAILYHSSDGNTLFDEEGVVRSGEEKSRNYRKLPWEIVRLIGNFAVNAFGILAQFKATPTSSSSPPFSPFGNSTSSSRTLPVAGESSYCGVAGTLQYFHALNAYQNWYQKNTNRTTTTSTTRFGYSGRYTSIMTSSALKTKLKGKMPALQTSANIHIVTSEPATASRTTAPAISSSSSSKAVVGLAFSPAHLHANWRYYHGDDDDVEGN